MIEAINVTKDFGVFRALHQVSFNASQGEIIGFLGQNGAGKTTLMRILTTYLRASSGTVRIAGYDSKAHPLICRKHIGYLPETPPLYDQLTVEEYLRFAARLKDVPTKKILSALDRAIEDCQLGSVRKQYIATLSKGYKQRVGIAQAIIHDPSILILDEPTNGLDPVQIQHVRKLMNRLRSKRIVIVSTHILSEIERVVERVIIIKHGRIVIDKSIKTLLKEDGPVKRIISIRHQIQEAKDVVINDSRFKAACYFKSINDDNKIYVSESASDGLLQDLLQRLVQAGVTVLEVSANKRTLEHVFLKSVETDNE